MPCTCRDRSRWLVLVLALCVASPSWSAGPPAASVPLLPPAPAWDGRSRELLVPASDPWATPFERSGRADSPSYDETFSWLRRLAAAAARVHMASLGKSPEGRDLWIVIASEARAPTPDALRGTGKPTLLVQAGIHAGEIDGKDAGMMLLRDMTVRGTKRELLDGANFLFVPILNVDGHERRSRFSRINQRGPETAGWRTTSRNLNLNRDYTKLDTPEMRAMVRALRLWDPDLYLDVHVTDGIDCQYDVTFGYNGRHAHSPAIATWLDDVLSPALVRDLRAMGHIPGPLVFPADDHDLARGIAGWTADPRYSNGYADAVHVPGVLVENHSLKPFEQRVLGTYVTLESILRTLAAGAGGLRKAIAADRALRSPVVPLAWDVSDSPPETIELLGIEPRLAPSAISGGVRVEWTGRPVTMRIPLLAQTRPKFSARRPAAYWIPPALDDVIERLEIHGVRMERIAAPREIEVEMYRMGDVKLAQDPFEGHVTVTAASTTERRRERFPAGSVRVPTDQPLGDLAILLLEPPSPDSFFSWGFLLQFLERTEYVEGYVIEPMAERMLAEDPKLAEEFRKKLLADEKFRGSPADRLRFFYERTPFFDERFGLYPIGVER